MQLHGGDTTGRRANDLQKGAVYASMTLISRNTAISHSVLRIRNRAFLVSIGVIRISRLSP